VTPNQRSNALAGFLLIAITPLCVLFHWRETRENWKNGR
jgi:hypothetical protein